MRTNPPDRVEDNPALFGFQTLNELVDFFDTHDMGEYADQMPEAHFEVLPRQDAQQGSNGQFIAGTAAEEHAEYPVEGN